MTSLLATDYTQDANCVGAWLFRDGSGTSLTDASSAGHNGSISQAVWTTTAPVVATNSLLFDGSDDYVSAADPSSITNTLTVVSYAKSNSVTNYRHMVSFHPGFFLSNNATAGYVRFAVTTTGEVSHNITSFASIGTSSWNHFAGTYDGTAVNGYFNGIVGTGDSCTGNIDTSGNFAIGSYWNTHDTFNTYNGYISESAIFNRVLSSTEINEIMDHGLKPASSPAPSVPFLPPVMIWEN